MLDGPRIMAGMATARPRSAHSGFRFIYLCGWNESIWDLSLSLSEVMRARAIENSSCTKLRLTTSKSAFKKGKSNWKCNTPRPAETRSAQENTRSEYLYAILASHTLISSQTGMVRQGFSLHR